MFCNSTRAALAIYAAIMLELCFIIVAVVLRKQLLIIPVVAFPGSIFVGGVVVACRLRSQQNEHGDEEGQDMEVLSDDGGSIGTSTVSGIGVDGHGVVVDMDYTKAMSLELESSSKRLQVMNSIQGLRIRFTYQELVEATNNFARKLPSFTTFDEQFEGIHHLTGQRIVVLKFEIPGGNEMAERYFQAELASASANHRCMVQLLGFCVEGKQRFLVYEHMANGALKRWIFGHDGLKGTLLAWSKRLKLAIDVARGLTYLHEWCQDQIVPFGIDTQNILLDENFCPKFVNFGAAVKHLHLKRPQRSNSSRRFSGQIVPSKEEHVAPDAVITQKTDVFSYGVFLLEIVSGQSSQDPETAEEELSRTNSLARSEFAQECMNTFKTRREEVEEPSTASIHGIEQFVDPRLGGHFQESEAVRMVQVAMWCIQTDPVMRPTMSMVTHMLEGHFDVNNSLPKSLKDFKITKVDANDGDNWSTSQAT